MQFLKTLGNLAYCSLIRPLMVLALFIAGAVVAVGVAFLISYVIIGALCLVPFVGALLFRKHVACERKSDGTRVPKPWSDEAIFAKANAIKGQASAKKLWGSRKKVVSSVKKAPTGLGRGINWVIRWVKSCYN